MTTDTDTRYNGWTNYETWNVALWLDNDQSSYLYVRELARGAQGNVGVLANTLCDMVNENAPDLGASTYADMLGAALSSVDWYEIAQNVLDES